MAIHANARVPYIARMRLVLCVLAAVLSAAGCAPVSGTRRAPVAILSYNVENLFDDVADETEYPDYNPENGWWNAALYRCRLERTAQVIRESVRGGPDIVALQEIENERVLNDLAETGLADQGYRYVVLCSSAGSPTNVGVLSRFPVLRTAAYPVRDEMDRTPTRDILEISIDCSGIRLSLLACHWKSRLGGAEYTEPLRIRAASVVADAVEALLAGNDRSEVLVLGDMNESVDEWQRIGMRYQTALEILDPFAAVPLGTLAVTIDRGTAVSSGDHRLYFSPWGEASACGDNSGNLGSYLYDGKWETLDNFLLTPGLLDQQGLSYSDFWVVPHSYLRDENGYPLAWMLETGRGYSDHLPIVLVLEHCR